MRQTMAGLAILEPGNDTAMTRKSTGRSGWKIGVPALMQPPSTMIELSVVSEFSCTLS